MVVPGEVLWGSWRLPGRSVNGPGGTLEGACGGLWRSWGGFEQLLCLKVPRVVGWPSRLRTVGGSGEGPGTPREPRDPREPEAAQAELVGFVNRFVARRFACRFAFACASLYIAFASPHLAFTSLRISNRTESNFESHTPTCSADIYIYNICTHILYSICIYIHIKTYKYVYIHMYIYIYIDGKTTARSNDVYISDFVAASWAARPFARPPARPLARPSALLAARPPARPSSRRGGKEANDVAT